MASNQDRSERINPQGITGKREMTQKEIVRIIKDKWNDCYEVRGADLMSSEEIEDLARIIHTRHQEEMEKKIRALNLPTKGHLSYDWLIERLCK